MFNTFEKYPWWRTTLADVDSALGSVKRGEVKTLCESAGGRPIRYAVWGESRRSVHSANYSSACGAHNPKFYVDRESTPPVVMLIGAVHGQELEGTAALLNLISLIESGRDLRGCTTDELESELRLQPELGLESALERGVRLIVIPVLNVDGRARCIPDSMLDMTSDELRYHGQGTWLDGSLCSWPECKSVHPIKSASEHLGSYYNDDGVNLMHDDFFNPMARETAAILKLAADEAPDYIIQLHGGSNSTNELLPTHYVSHSAELGLKRLAEYCAELTTAVGLPAKVNGIPDHTLTTPPSFNLASALHHACGGVSAVYESNEGLCEKNAFTPEAILKLHYILFESVLNIK